MLPDAAVMASDCLDEKTSLAPDAVAVVISHDCDLAHAPAAEAGVEFIIGRRVIGNIDGNFSHGKTARRLHLTLSGGKEKLSVELAAAEKHTISKVTLASFEPVAAFVPTAGELIILQRWLASRYLRSAFPDEFNRRINELRLDKKINTIMKPSSSWISAILFDIYDQDNIKRSGRDDPYTLNVYFLYNTDNDPHKADKIASDAAKAITKVFADTCFSNTSGCWENFELVECEAISDQAMSVHDIQRLKKWSSDHVSLKSDPPGAMVTNG